MPHGQRLGASFEHSRWARADVSFRMRVRWLGTPHNERFGSASNKILICGAAGACMASNPYGCGAAAVSADVERTGRSGSDGSPGSP